MKLYNFLIIALLLISKNIFADLTNDLDILANRLEALQLVLVIETSKAEYVPEQPISIGKKPQKLKEKISKLNPLSPHKQQLTEKSIMSPKLVPPSSLHPQPHREHPRYISKRESASIEKEKEKEIEEQNKTPEQPRKFKKPVLILQPFKPTFEESNKTSLKLRQFMADVNSLSGEEQRDKAQELNKQINEDINSGKLKIPTKLDQDVLFKIITRILSFNPLLIETALDTLQKAEIHQEKLYRLMYTLYKTRVDFIEYEFALARQQGKKFKLTAGERRDVQEGLQYPLTIATETQNAEILANKENNNKAQQFFKGINNQKERLLRLLGGDPKETEKEREEFAEVLKEQGIDIVKAKALIEKVQPQAYCKTSTPEGCRPYKSLYKTIDTILDEIKNYNEIENYNKQSTSLEEKEKYTRDKKYILDNIVNKLNALEAYNSDLNYCQDCFIEDAYQDMKRKESQREYNKKFDELIFFFGALDETNPIYNAVLEKILNIKKIEDTRRYLIKKSNVNDLSNKIHERKLDWGNEYYDNINEIMDMISRG